jgi:dihydroorotate dehydrogenase electron transfer subunit
MIDTIATVDSNAEIAPGYRRMTLTFDHEIPSLAGQFMMLRARGVYEPLLRRALAVYDSPGPRQLSFLFQILGRGTEALSRLGAGAQVDCLGPLGNSWLSPPAPERPPAAVVVAGGIGSASVLMLCRDLASASVRTAVLFGAASHKAAIGCGLADFKNLRLPLTVTTDDGSLGEKGFVTGPLERLLGEGEDKEAVIYSCGPWAMMKRVAEISEKFGNRCIVSLEAPMGCGFGVCVGCVVAMKTDQVGYDSYKRVCIDGSIFSADRIDWSVDAMGH